MARPFALLLLPASLILAWFLCHSRSVTYLTAALGGSLCTVVAVGSAVVWWRNK